MLYNRKKNLNNIKFINKYRGLARKPILSPINKYYKYSKYNKFHKYDIFHKYDTFYKYDTFHKYLINNRLNKCKSNNSVRPQKKINYINYNYIKKKSNKENLYCYIDKRNLILNENYFKPIKN